MADDKKKKLGLVIAIGPARRSAPPEPPFKKRSPAGPAAPAPKDAPGQLSTKGMDPSAADPDGDNDSGAESGKIPKEAVLYAFRPETDYTCDKCVFYKEQGPQCAIFGPSEQIQPFGSCGFWIHHQPGEQAPQIPWLGLVTKEEAGYDENPTGFSCKRCEYYDPSMDCEKVDKNSEGDTEGIIHPNACCNRWEADAQRASLPLDALMAAIGGGGPTAHHQTSPQGDGADQPYGGPGGPQ